MEQATPDWVSKSQVAILNRPHLILNPLEVSMIVFTVLTGKEYLPYLNPWLEGVQKYIKPKKIICFTNQFPKRKYGIIHYEPLDLVDNNNNEKLAHLFKVQLFSYAYSFTKENKSPCLFLDIDLIVQDFMEFPVIQPDYLQVGMVRSIYPTVEDLLKARPSYKENYDSRLPLHLPNYNSGLVLFTGGNELLTLASDLGYKSWLKTGQDKDQLSLLTGLHLASVKVLELPQSYNSPEKFTAVGWHDFRKSLLFQSVAAG